MLDLLKKRRSIRKFEPKEVEKEKIDTILKAALLAPSSRALRPWEFIAVTDKEVLKELSNFRGNGSKFLADAPLGIVVLADHEICDVWVEDASITASIMQLTAVSLGLGSCWMQTRERVHDENTKAGDYVKKLLGIPDKYSVLCILAIGYPAEDKKPYSDEDLLYGKIHNNKF
ncbi:NADPH-flavin oxidoreductase [Oxobacter pfennigii]|uniref:NADPH-flavin oxidoreductase n=1 Tax=Oxobacter pfennigii TaxID=36849 RepID=A0A0P8WLQ4_9CLOT|nr:nitroreductase family protein [Oxobacter pfennigii]KPU43390.1 NADPH-flavin oxidoreductase [Oxobacter pfennigii]